ncbi:MAG: helix-turn-helix domain-containing protein [Pseudomonadota bacterium]
MLQSNSEMVVDMATSCSTHDVFALGDGFRGLLRGLFSRELYHKSAYQQFSQSREIAIRRAIKDNLRDPTLGPKTLCRMIGVSRAVLYRMFDEDGGVQRAIQKQRLECARKELARSEPTRGAIARIAAYWTYYDQAHFSRLFREEFGIRPSDAIGSELLPLRHQEDQRREGDKSKIFVKPLIDLYKSV